MELGLSLGESPTPFSSLEKTQKKNMSNSNNKIKELGFCMGLGNAFCRSDQEKRELDHQDHGHDQDQDHDDDDHEMIRRRVCGDPVVPLQLDLLPSAPVPRSHITTSSQFRFPWLTDNLVLSEPGSSDGPGKGFDVNRLPPPPAAAAEEAEEGVTISSPNSTLSSFHMDFCVRTSSSTGSGRNNNYNYNNINKNNNNKRDINNNTELDAERTSSRASDDEENGSTRKKLRLSKEQSAFLEESFKEHSTLNPKQKLALAKQLNLRPRQVEVWFQNRRARTKLKQTEVDCEYLKRCCETLTEENRRLQKELQELRALKTSQPFYMQLPATTLTMCPSCERVATANPTGRAGCNSPATLPLAKPIINPFSHHAQPGKAAASL